MASADARRRSRARQRCRSCWLPRRSRPSGASVPREPEQCPNPRRPVEAASGVNAHIAVIDDAHHPVAIELHFVEPVRPDRRRALAAKAGPAVKSVPATRSRCRVPLCQDFGMPLFSVSRRGAFHSLFSEETRAPALDWARRPQLAPAQPVIPPRCRISACALAEPA